METMCTHSQSMTSTSTQVKPTQSSLQQTKTLKKTTGFQSELEVENQAHHKP